MNKLIRITCKYNELIDVDVLKDFQGSLKTLSKEGYEKLKLSIQKYGFTFPIFVWKHRGKYNIIDGHQRKNTVLQMLKEGWTLSDNKLPVVFIEAKDIREAKEKVLQAVSQHGRVDEEGLYEYLNVNELNFDDLKLEIDLPNFDLDKFEIGYIQDTSEDEFDVEQALAKPKYEVKYGDIYRCGRHRVMCGDSCKKEDVERLMGGEKADMIFTDPPYGVGYENKTDNILGNSRKSSQIKGDNFVKGELEKIIRGAFTNIKNNLADINSYYICSPQGGEMGLMMMMMMECGIPCRHVIIWKKNRAVFSMGRLDYDYIHEPLLYGWVNRHKFYGKNEKSVWEIDNALKNDLHPTQKPLELCSRAINNSSKKDNIVLDLFGGSGSTLIASHSLGRICLMMEIDERYCSVILERYETYTGEKVVKL